MKLDMLPLLSGAENKITFDYTLPVGEDTLFSDEGFVFHDIGFQAPVHITGEAANQAGYMTLSLQAEVAYETHCARCLREIHGTHVFRLEKPIGETKGQFRLENDDEEEYLPIEDNSLALDEAVRELILMEFPMRHLCREDCLGLCPRCGKDRNEGDCACETHEQDPRLAKLAALLEKQE